MARLTPRIVVVDNGTPYIRMLQRLLAEEGYEVQLYTDEEEGLAERREEPPDLIVLDIRLGYSLRSWDLLDVLRLDLTITRIPLILCTGIDFVLSPYQDQLRALRVLTQPRSFDINEIIATIEAALGEWGNVSDAPND